MLCELYAGNCVCHQAGKFMGIIGMIIGVPVFAIIYSIIKEEVEYKLKNKNLPTETKDYMDKM